MSHIKVVTLGIYVHYDNAETEALNMLILLGKAYVWKYKFDRCNPSIAFFVLYFKRATESNESL